MTSGALGVWGAAALSIRIFGKRDRDAEPGVIRFKKAGAEIVRYAVRGAE
jgi:hypothetical protein